jgi:hypothetical protein
MLLVFNWAKQILKIARDFEPALGEPRRARRASVPFSAALRAAESVGKIPESLILVRLFDEIRTFFERN